MATEFSSFENPSSDKTSMQRRYFLKGSGAIGASLVVGFWAAPKHSVAASPANSQYRIDAFITIGSDDSVTLTMSKIEMGQGTYTSIPMLIAEELEVDVNKVVIHHSPPDVKAYGAPFGDQFTGGSSSVRTLWLPMREAGAAARTVLIQAAAETWHVPAGECRAELGQVIHSSSGKRISYGKLVDRASRLQLPAKVELKPASEFKTIGRSVKRLDAKGKTDGTAMFGIDVVLPNMKFASVVASPTIGGRVTSVNDSKARALPGVRDVVKLDNVVAVIADNTWYARAGASALEIVWDGGSNASLTTGDVQSLMQSALKRPGLAARNDGDAVKFLQGDSKRVEASYINPMLAHATMEPMNCTVHVQDGGAEIWVGTQVPARARDTAAKILGLPPEKVTLHNQLLGGGFGRRLYHDYVDQAVRVAQKVKGPVKVTWTREEDIQHDIFRGLYAHSVSASLDSKGNPIALNHRIAGPASVATFAPGWLKDGVDPDFVDGSIGLAYDIPNFRIEQIREDGPIPTGFWRGVGPTRNVLVLESFIDELATRAGRDPLEYRLGLLGKDRRAANVLQLAAKMSDWGQPLAPRAGRGIALLHAWDTYLAQVVDLTVDATGDVTVQRVVCAVDCGVVINPDTVIAQMQGGIVYGLSAALFGEITLKNGRVEQSNFHDYRVMRMPEAPKIDVQIVKSSEAPGGIGEPGTAGVGAAFTNAIYSATGRRLYSLPIRPDELKTTKAA